MAKLLARMRTLGAWSLTLLSGEVLTLDRPIRLEVRGGRAWITVEGEPDDWFLTDGQVFTPPVGRQTVIQADTDITLVIRATSLRAVGLPLTRRAGNLVSRLRAAALRRLPASFAADLVGNLRSGLSVLRA